MSLTPTGPSHLNGTDATNGHTPKLAAPDATIEFSKDYRLFPSSRFAISVMLFLLGFFMMFHRVNLGLSLVCMVKSTRMVSTGRLGLDYNSTVAKDSRGGVESCHSGNMSTTEIPINYSGCATRNASVTWIVKGELDWNKKLHGLILSSYFWGYISTQALGGWLGGRYGGKHVAGFGLLVSAISTLILPSAARLSPYFVIVLRVLLGAGSGVFGPIAQSLLGRWIPPLERSFLTAISFLGTAFGTAAAFVITAQFCSVRLDNGWPFAFYSSGGFSFLVWIAWNFVVFNSPFDHPRISKHELEYIAHCTKTSSDSTPRKPFPWLTAIRSPAVISIAVAQTAGTWVLHTSITMFPSYMAEVLKFDIRQNGLYLMLPHILTIICNPFVGQLADVLRRRRILSTIAVRKISQSISHFGSALLFIGISFVDKETRYVAVALNILISSTQTVFSRSGYIVSPQDIAPKYSGEVFGISNTVGTLSGIISPIICGYLTPNGTASEWKNVFYIAAAVLVAGGIFFCIFAEGEVQSWAKGDSLPANGVAILEATVAAVDSAVDVSSSSDNRIMTA